MRGVSAQSLDAVLRRVREVIENEHDLDGFAQNLFDAAAAIDSSNQLVRTLSDAGRDSELKSTVVSTLFRDRVSPGVLAVIDEVARRQWSEQNHLLEALERAGVYALLIRADRDGAAGDVENELFQFARIVEESADLSEAFDATRDRTEAREELVQSLLAGRANPVTVLIARQAVRFDTMIKVPKRLDGFAKFASELRQRRIGIVTSAVSLGAEQQTRLSRILHHKYGTEISLNYEIDPDVLGGMQITIGDDLYDATIAGRVKTARETLSA